MLQGKNRLILVSSVAESILKKNLIFTIPTQLFRPFFSSTLGWGANGEKYKGFTEKYSICMCNVFSNGIQKNL